ncbi:NUDIX domain-containing protein [Arthrobacter zhaoxinii]|uniref:NUDIX domain-containing protein n=1 Tax=Arthrobacter zhaoxinii TaxID=2964616 RepID=UPI002105898D|nr:NUDIX domain-containing protein [Arthrobacter zhaoxinii]MCQ2000572.1 NUDIX domain-containing protein [Arthrobacter zhaoxinii]
MSIDRQQPLVSIDTVPFIGRDGGLCVVTAERANEPFAGVQALPGVLLLPSERLAEAALRALTAKTGVGEGQVEYIGTAGVYDNPDRDPRGPTISIVHTAVLQPDARLDETRAKVTPVEQVSGLPFDHDTIIRRTAGTVLDALWVDQPLTKALLGKHFTTAQAARLIRNLAAAAGRSEPDSSNLGRMLARNPALSKSSEAVAAGRGRPAAGWSWT